MNRLYDITIPAFRRGLTNLRAWLAVAERHAERTGTRTNDLLDARLAPDMYGLTQQVGYAYFTALEAVENLAGIPQPAMSYEETTVDELYASIDRAIDHLERIEPADIDESPAREVETFLRPDRKIAVQEYVTRFALPNFYFHIVTAYDILRHRGVPLGKADYIGADSE